MIDISNVQLETSRTIIRSFRKSDLNDFYEYAKIEGVGETAGWQHHKNIDETKLVLDMFVREKNVFAIVHKESNKVIGSIGLHNSIDKDVFSEYLESKIIEIGFVLSKDYWSYGIMPEVVNSVCEYLFKEKKYDYVVAGYFEGNEKSKRVQEKCGFKEYKKGTYNKNSSGHKMMFTILSKKDNC